MSKKKYTVKVDRPDEMPDFIRDATRKFALNKAKIYEWALKKGREYVKIRDNYLRLCTSCHHGYDNLRAKQWNTLHAYRQRRSELLPVHPDTGQVDVPEVPEEV